MDARRLLGLVGALAGTGCGCGELACSGTLVVDLGPLAPGAWQLDVDLEDFGAFSCALGEARTCDDPRVEVQEEEGTTLVVLSVGMARGYPAWAEVTLRHDDDLRRDGTFAVDWSAPWYPNGFECDRGLGCRRAELVVRPDPA